MRKSRKNEAYILSFDLEKTIDWGRLHNNIHDNETSSNQCSSYQWGETQYYFKLPRAKEEIIRKFRRRSENGGRGGIRTPDRRVKSPLLYLAELRAH